MEQQPAKKRRGPASKLGKILINLIVTAVVGFLYFYVALPPINLRVFMATLRKKIEPDPSHPRYIQTHIGVGYRMIRQPDEEAGAESEA